MAPGRVFILSPARLDGKRGQLLLSPRAAFPLARALGEDAGVPIGEAFSFLSGLYFRGKRAYADAFGRAPDGVSGAYIITTHRGLVAPDLRVTRRDLESFAKIDLGDDPPEFREPLLRDALRLRDALDSNAEIVLLGSIATGKYVDPLIAVFGERLLFPETFVGRGDMSRGGVLLRAVRDQRELVYAPVVGSIRHGKRPPRLPKLKAP